METFELRISPIKTGEINIENYDEAKAYIMDKVETYKNAYYSEDQKGLAKDDRARLNKLKKAISDMRITKKKEYLEPFNDFEEKMKELAGLTDEALEQIDSQVKAFDEKRKAEKQKAIEELFSQIGFQNFVTLEKIQDPKWLNASTSMKSIEDQMKSKMYEIGNGVLTLSQLPEFGFEATEVFKETLDINKAISEAKRMSEIAKAKAEAEARRKAAEEARKAAEEARRKAEEERKAQERAAMAQAMTPPEDAQPAPVEESQPEPQKMVVKFEVELTTDDAAALREFFQSRNITFRAIK
ncbi:DUF1351 domain-containing protein [Coprococcus sp. AF16-5]|uniref:DUF1351 domain-containing protein n=1 Tax=Coprococcus sp. AF16-5 TaxID=2293088 RepID=UPI000E553701|nr:DUF1351 domain-containing protein [Coprococcus sp. AF16-5]RHR65761.1 DUF1351 domain-containing protein [Coprococcus sp. AF16-5]